MSTSETALELRVTSFHPSPTGGGILIGTDEKSGRSCRVRIGRQSGPRSPRPAESWRLIGTWVQDAIHGTQLQARHASPLIPRGEAITKWIAENPAIVGVGKVTAAKLWRMHGADLYRILRDGDSEALLPAVGPLTATAITTEFRLLADEVTVLQHFDGAGLDASTAMAACRLWGIKAIEKLEENPYNLALLEPWSTVDRRARELGIASDDDRRLIAAVNELMARRYRAGGTGVGGHTASPRADIIMGVRQMLGKATAHLAEHAFHLACDRGEIVQCAGLWQARGPHLMERVIEQDIRQRATARTNALDEVTSAIRDVETEIGVRFDPLQADAVRAAIMTKFAVIDGPAGTGKSLVTRAILRAVEKRGGSYTQMALSGRAAKRLREATGHEALTVHRFLKDMANGRRKLSAGILLIDEASMISTPDLWQIVSWSPPETGLVLVGDPAQLPPIGAGNPFAAIASTPQMPRTTLRNIHRQSGSSPIPIVANAIRAGVLPQVQEFDASNPQAEGVFMASCDTADVFSDVLRVFEAFVGPPPTGPDREAIRRLHRARCQILGMTVHGTAGVQTLSEAIESRWLSLQPPVPGWGLAEGSKILWTRNSYDHPIGRPGPDGAPLTADIMNGSLGIVQRSTPDGAVVLFDDEASTKAEVRATDLERISRGWAVTIHKAQGSAFDRVILPIVRSRLLDRQMLYTAVTRARRSVVLVGDPALLTSAVAAEPRAKLRRQCLFAEEYGEQVAA